MSELREQWRNINHVMTAQEDEIIRLRAINAALVRAAKDLLGMASGIEHAVRGQPYTAQSVAYVLDQFRAAVSKAEQAKE